MLVEQGKSFKTSVYARGFIFNHMPFSGATGMRYLHGEQSRDGEQEETTPLLNKRAHCGGCTPVLAFIHACSSFEVEVTANKTQHLRSTGVLEQRFRVCWTC